MVATEIGFFNFPKTFHRPTEWAIGQKSLNGVQPPLTAIISTHLFMLDASHMQSTRIIDISLM